MSQKLYQNKHYGREQVPPRKPYVPEYKRKGILPIPIDEYGRVDEQELDLRATSVPPFRSSPQFHVDGVDESVEETEDVQDEVEQEEVESNHKSDSSRVKVMNSSPHPSKIAPGEYVILVNGKIVASGEESFIIDTITSLVYKKSVDLDDLVVLKRMEVNFGFTIK